MKRVTIDIRGIIGKTACHAMLIDERGSTVAAFNVNWPNFLGRLLVYVNENNLKLETDPNEIIKKLDKSDHWPSKEEPCGGDRWETTY